MEIKKFLTFFEQKGLPVRYIKLCNKFSNFDDYKKLKKIDFLKIFNKYELNLKYSKQESLFYEDLDFNDYQFRFLLSYKYGLISSMYMISDKEKSIIRKNLSDISEELDSSFEKKVNYKCPIVTSEIDLEEIYK